MKEKIAQVAWRTSLGYAIAGVLWILLSDRALELLVNEPGLITRISMLKGWIFVIATALLLHLILRRQLRRLEVSDSARLEAETALQERKQTLKYAQSLAQLGSWTVDIPDEIFHASPEAARLLGWKPGAHKLESLCGLIHPDDLPRVRNQWKEATQKGNLDIEHRVLLEGVVRWMHVKAEVSFDEAGHPTSAIGVAQDITERKRAEAALRENVSLLRTVLDNSPDTIFLKSKEGRMLLANSATLAVIGKPAEEVLGKTVREYLPDQDFARRIMEKEQQIMDAGVLQILEENIAGSDGTRRFLTTFVPHQNEEGQVVGLIGIGHDVTKRHRAEAAMRRWADAFEHCAYGLAMGDPADDTILACNPAYARMQGRLVEEVIGHPILDAYAPDDRARVQRSIAAADEAGEVQFEAYMRRADDSVFPVQMNLVSVRSAAGLLQYRVVTAQDVTKRREAEIQLRRSEQRFRNLVETTVDWVWEVDAQGRYTYVSPKVKDLLGFQPEEVTGRTPFDFMPEAEADRVRAAFKRHLEQKRDFAGLENINLHKDGHQVVLESSGVPVLGLDGSVVGYRGIDRDVTDRRRAEEMVRKLSRAVEQSSASIIITDPSGLIEYVNSRFVEVTGYTLEEVRGCHPRLLVSDETPSEDYQHLWETVSHGGEWHGEFQNRRKDGTLYWETATISPIVDDAGRITNFLAVTEDITMRRHLEAQLRQSQKLEAIGQLAGGVAHDFNNILAAMLLQLELLQMDNAMDANTLASVKELESEARRAASLTRQLLLFSRRSVLQARPLDPNEVVEHLLKMLRRLIGEHISLQFNADTGLPWIQGDAGMLDQVLMNLVVNARDAMPKGGRLTISTSAVKVEGGHEGSLPNARPGNYVRLSVSDTGCGMDEEVLQRIFEPFYTTKSEGKGTGLGLATVYGIAQQHGGWVDVESTIGKGSVFHVYLPALSPTFTVQASDEAPRRGGGSETILLVEDEPDVRRSLGAFLRRCGYRVLEAADAPEALHVWEQHASKIDLLYTDMVMPGGMNGLELAQGLRHVRPNLKIIISSGYSEELSDQHTGSDSSIVFLPKPCQPGNLSTVVRECLDQPIG